MSAQRVVNRNMLEAIYERALAEKITPALKQRLRPLGLDLDQPLPTSLTVPIYARCLAITVEEVFPELEPKEGMTELARRLTHAHCDTAVGYASAKLAHLLGPQRMLRWLGRMFRAVDSYSSVRVIEEGPTCFRIMTNATDVPVGYGEGVFEELLRIAGANDPHAEAIGGDETGDAFRVWWSEPPGR